MLEAPIAYYLIIVIAAAAVLGLAYLEVKAKREIAEERASRAKLSSA